MNQTHRGYIFGYTKEVPEVNQTHRVHIWVYESMFDFHRSDRGSNPGRGGKIS